MHWLVIEITTFSDDGTLSGDRNNQALISDIANHI